MNNRLIRTLVIVAVAVGIGALIWMASAVLDRVHGVLTMILLAVLVAYLVAPLVTLLSRRGIPRAFAVFAVYIVLFAVVGSGIAWLAPRAALEAADLSRRAPSMARSAQAQLADPNSSPLLSHLPGPLRDAIAGNVETAQTAAAGAAGAVGARVFGVARAGAEGLVRTLLVLFLAFFFITDAERIAATLLRMVPEARRGAVLDWVRDIDTVVGGFVRGQVLVAAVTGAIVMIALLILGVPYAVLLGTLAGVTSIVPFVGPIVGAIPALALAIFAVGAVKTIILLVLFVVIFEVQGHVLTPIVIGRTVGVTPLVVFLAILIGAEAFGLLGMLLAIPIAGILRVALDRLFPRDPRTEALVAAKLGTPVRDAAPPPPP